MKIPQSSFCPKTVAPKSLFDLVRQTAKLPPAFFVLSLGMFVAGIDVPSASAQGVAYSGSGAVDFGAVDVCPSGKAKPAPCAKTLALSYKVTESGTLGTPLALTVGAPGLDYKLASGTTCSGRVAKGATCQVDVAFAPTEPGTRDGAVEIVDASGNALATTYIYGTGVGPAVGFDPPAQTQIGGRSFPYAGGAFAMDGSGNLFIFAASPEGDGVVEELVAVNGSLPANPVVKTLAQVDGYMAYPAALAVDGAGNLFIAVSEQYYDLGYVQEVPAAGGYARNIALGGGFNFGSPTGLAVDGSGNLFVSTGYYPDEIGVWQGGLYELPAAAGYATVKPLGGASQFPPYGAIALDANGNLFAAFSDENTGFGAGDVVKLTPADNYSTAKVLNVNDQGVAPQVIALDPAGDLFAAYTESNVLTEYLAVNGVLPANPASRAYGQFTQPYELASDGRGDLLLADDAGLHELLLSTPSSTPLDFALTGVGQTSYDSPQSVLIQNQGNAVLDLSALSVSPNWDLVKGSGTPENCSASTGLAVGALCDISVSFEPTETGPLTGAVSLGDDSLNLPGSAQSIPLSGVGTDFPPPHISSLNSNVGAPYSVVTIDGTNFGAAQGSSVVTFNGIPTPHYHWSNTQIYVTVPPNATTGSLVVAVGGQASNAVEFFVAPQPVLTGISPTGGPVGTVVSINGENLVDYDNKATVTFNGKYLQVLSDTATAIQVQIPAGAVSGDFHVLVNDTGMNSPIFTVKK